MNDEQERYAEADYFARILLMDEESFRKAFEKLKEAVPNRPDLVVVLLAEAFCVPEEQVAIRSRELGLSLL